MILAPVTGGAFTVILEQFYDCSCSGAVLRITTALGVILFLVPVYKLTEKLKTQFSMLVASGSGGGHHGQNAGGSPPKKPSKYALKTGSPGKIRVSDCKS